MEELDHQLSVELTHYEEGRFTSSNMITLVRDWCLLSLAQINQIERKIKFVI